MACRLNDFTVGEWKRVETNGHKVDLAPAVTKGLRLDGFVYKLDGKFQGFVGSESAVMYWVANTLIDAHGNATRQ